MKVIFERELKSYFTNLYGYVFGAFILLFTGIYTMVINLNTGYANFEYVLGNMTFIVLVAVPVLSMRIIAEEKRQKTDQLLYSLPLSMTKVVMGKYLAMLVVILIPILIICLYPLFLTSYGTIALATAYGSIFAFYCLIAALSAIGLFVSSLTENQAVAAALCFVAMLLLYFMSDLASYVPSTSSGSFIAFAVLILVVAIIVRLLTKNTLIALILAFFGEIILLVCYSFWTEKFAGLFGSIIEQLSVFDRFYTFMYGMIDITCIIYFLSIAGVFLFLSVQSLEKRRWS